MIASSATCARTTPGQTPKARFSFGRRHSRSVSRAPSSAPKQLAAYGDRRQKTGALAESGLAARSHKPRGKELGAGAPRSPAQGGPARRRARRCTSRRGAREASRAGRGRAQARAGAGAGPESGWSARCRRPAPCAPTVSVGTGYANDGEMSDQHGPADPVRSGTIPFTWN